MHNTEYRQRKGVEQSKKQSVRDRIAAANNQSAKERKRTTHYGFAGAAAEAGAGGGGTGAGLDLVFGTGIPPELMLFDPLSAAPLLALLLPGTELATGRVSMMCVGGTGGAV